MQHDILLMDTQSASMCGACGGACCKQMPGGAHPSDWGAPNRDVMRALLTAALNSGQYTIDWWEGDPRGLQEDDPGYVSQGFYVRPAIKGYEGYTYHAGWGGECTFLTPTGCAMPHANRPLECRTLEPKYPMRCEQHHGKYATAIAWIEYHDVLSEIVVNSL